jgi:hypothetical protein
LDDRLAGGNIFTPVAAGNAGHRDTLSGLNRVQSPSDAVNLLCVGVCDEDQLAFCSDQTVTTNYSQHAPISSDLHPFYARVYRKTRRL